MEDNNNSTPKISVSDAANSDFNELGGKLSIVEKVGYGLGDTASNILYQAWSFFLAKFYTDVFGIPARHAATMFIVTRIWDTINDPIMGMVADRTKTRWGKFRPYLLWVGVPYGFLIYAMFVTPDWSQNMKIVYAYATYILATMAYTAINIPYSSMMAVMTPDPKERTTLSQYRFFLAFVGMMLITTFMLPLVKFFGANPAYPGYSETLGYSRIVGYKTTMAVFGAIAVVLLVITFLTTRERVVAPPLPAGSMRRDLHELRRNAHYIGMAFVSIAVTIVMIMYRAVLLAELTWRADSTSMKVLAYVILVGLVGLAALAAIAAIWRAIRNTSFGNDIRDLSHNTPWVILFIACVFWLTHNMIRNGTVAFYFDYVGAGNKTLFSLGTGAFHLDFDLTTTFLTIGTAGMMAGVFISTPFKKRFGKKPLSIFLAIAASVLGAVFYVLPRDNFVLLGVFNFLWAVVAGATPVFLFAMFADATDFHEWKFDRRATGLVIAGIMFAIKLGVAIGGWLQLRLLDAFGYEANVAQTPEALMGIKLLFSVIPAGFILVCGIVLCFYPINEKQLAQMEVDLKERKKSEE